MADQVTDGRDHKLASPGFDDSLVGQGNGNDAHRPAKRRAVAQDDDDDDDDGKPGRERRKIDIKFIQDKSRRHITFSKRKAGIMKKVCVARSKYSSGFCFSSFADAEQGMVSIDATHAD